MVDEETVTDRQVDDMWDDIDDEDVELADEQELEDDADAEAEPEGDETAETDDSDTAEADEADEDSEDDEADEADEEDSDEADEEESEDDSGAGRVREQMQKRIDRVTGEKKELDEKYQDTLSENEKLKADAEKAREAAGAGVDPDYVEAADAEVVKRYGVLKQLRDWCTRHAETGYESEGDGPSFEPEDIRVRLNEVNDELMDVAPEAKRVQRESRKHMKSDLELGRKVRRKREQKRRTAKEAAGKGKPKRKSPKIDGQTAANAGEKASKAKKKKGIDREALKKGGYTDEAVIDAYGADGFFDA